MAQTSYKKGRRIEYLAKKKLEAEGYLVIRSAASKGPIDLVAVRNTVRFIQVKGRRPQRKELEKLWCLRHDYPALKVEVWVYQGKKGFHIWGTDQWV